MLSSVHYSFILLIVVSQVCCQTTINENIICDSTSLLCDPDNVLTEEKSNQLHATIKDVNNGSVCVCNCTYQQSSYIIAVAIVLELDSEENGLTFADNLRHEWLFSRTSCDDSILILYSNNSDSDSELFVVMGDPLEKLISNTTMDDIHKDCDLVDSIVECLELAVTKLDEAVTNAIEKKASTVDDDNLVWGILGLIAIISILGFHYYVKY